MKKTTCFLLLFCFISTFSQISFEELKVSSFTDFAKGNKMADIDGDGYLDIITYGNNSIDWYKNNLPNLGFSPKKIVVEFTGSNWIRSIDITDYDNDGDLDILGAEIYGDRLFLCRNIDGLGNFGSFELLKTIDQIHYVQHIDMDNDGDKDLLCKSIGIGYYENTNDINNYNNFRLINSDYINVEHEIQVYDLNNDNYPDIFYRFSNSLRWIQNNNGISFSPFNLINGVNNQYRKFDVGDIDNDGDIDIIGYAVSNTGNNMIIGHLNDGNSNFLPQQIFQQNLSTITELKLSDIDNDSNLDLLVSINYQNYLSDLSWFKNFGTNIFINQPVIDSSVRNLYEIEVFDINNDGLNDIITSSNSHKTTTYQNIGAGVFDNPKYPASKATGFSIAGDIDGDGDIDILSSIEGKICLYRKSNIDGNFENQILLSSNETPIKEIALGDLDGDTDLDVIFTKGEFGTGQNDQIGWFENLDGLGNFGVQNNILSNSYKNPDGIAVFDVDSDGDNDIVTSLSNWPNTGDKIVWFSNDGNGVFGTEQIIDAGLISVKNILASDINNDNKLDLLVASSNDNSISCFLNLDGLGNFGIRNVITTEAINVYKVDAGDLDSDDLKDVIYMANGTVKDLLWQKNLDGLGNFGPPQVINSNLASNGATTLVVGDIDNDADLDVILGESTRFTWSENLFGQANFEPPKNISNNIGYPPSSLLIDYDSDGDLDILTASLGNVIVFDNQGVTKNTIKGIVRLDVESNGCDIFDRKLPNIIISTTDGNDINATLTFRNEYSGQYRLYVGEGNFTTSVVSHLPNYYMLSPQSSNSDFIGFGNIDTIDFCIEPIGLINDLSVTLYPLNEPRPGFNVKYLLVFKNLGTTTLTGQTSIQFDESKIQFLNSIITPSTITSNSLVYEFIDLAPFEIKSTILNFEVFAPPTVNIGDSILFNTIITPISGDNSQTDNEHSLNQIVIGSYDPNDIKCLEGDEVLITDSDEYLHYIIRFQNTGTASAINVKVEHLLDQRLDWKSLQIEEMSHNGRITVTNESLVEFMFHNINLPHSSFNEEESNGYIAFKIKPKDNIIELGDIVSATANIFFDFNPPIITNTENTQYVSTLRSDSFSIESVQIYPNPVDNKFFIKSLNEIQLIEIYSSLGRKVFESNYLNTIDVSNLKSGVYFITIFTAKGKEVKKIIKK